ncbi:VOC family protein [Streptomyces anthocyanicus]|uniref:VOC family protein n=1 Tax=Streptomyces anthocyanicus TaxID=68174 RepID=UPI00368C20C5
MTPELVRVNFKARDDSALGRFWAEALGWRASSEGPGVTNLEPVGFDRPDPSAVCIDLVRVPDLETVKYRVHLELATTSEDRRAELATRLEELGATHADVGRSDAPWTVLADPEGTWNGIHLDVMSDPVEDQASEAARLEALGATRTDAGQGDVSWVVLTDLANNKYCVLERG